MLDAPHNRHQHGAAAHDVDDDEHVLPREPALIGGTFFAYHDRGYVGQHLERDHGHEQILLALVQKRLQEAPPHAHEGDDAKHEHRPTDGEDVVRRRPSTR